MYRFEGSVSKCCLFIFIFLFSSILSSSNSIRGVAAETSDPLTYFETTCSYERSIFIVWSQEVDGDITKVNGTVQPCVNIVSSLGQEMTYSVHLIGKESLWIIPALTDSIGYFSFELERPALMPLPLRALSIFSLPLGHASGSMDQLISLIEQLPYSGSERTIVVSSHAESVDDSTNESSNSSPNNSGNYPLLPPCSPNNRPVNWSMTHDLEVVSRGYSNGTIPPVQVGVNLCSPLYIESMDGFSMKHEYSHDSDPNGSLTPDIHSSLFILSHDCSGNLSVNPVYNASCPGDYHVYRSVVDPSDSHWNLTNLSMPKNPNCLKKTGCWAKVMVIATLLDSYWKCSSIIPQLCFPMANFYLTTDYVWVFKDGDHYRFQSPNSQTGVRAYQPKAQTNPPTLDVQHDTLLPNGNFLWTTTLLVSNNLTSGGVSGKADPLLSQSSNHSELHVRSVSYQGNVSSGINPNHHESVLNITLEIRFALGICTPGDKLFWKMELFFDYRPKGASQWLNHQSVHTDSAIPLGGIPKIPFWNKTITISNLTNGPLEKGIANEWEFSNNQLIVSGQCSQVVPSSYTHIGTGVAPNYSLISY